MFNDHIKNALPAAPDSVRYWKKVIFNDLRERAF